jgi:hypothetical protein
VPDENVVFVRVKLPLARIRTTAAVVSLAREWFTKMVLSVFMDLLGCRPSSIPVFDSLSPFLAVLTVRGVAVADETGELKIAESVFLTPLFDLVVLLLLSSSGEYGRQVSLRGGLQCPVRLAHCRECFYQHLIMALVGVNNRFDSSFTALLNGESIPVPACDVFPIPAGCRGGEVSNSGWKEGNRFDVT